MSFKLNNAYHCEPIEVTLSPDKTPVAYQAKVTELVQQGMSQEDAEEIASRPFELELYYEIGQGLFAVESEAVDNTTIFSPYTCDEGEPADDE